MDKRDNNPHFLAFFHFLRFYQIIVATDDDTVFINWKKSNIISIDQ